MTDRTKTISPPIFDLGGIKNQGVGSPSIFGLICEGTTGILCVLPHFFAKILMYKCARPCDSDNLKYQSVRLDWGEWFDPISR